MKCRETKFKNPKTSHFDCELTTERLEPCPFCGASMDSGEDQTPKLKHTWTPHYWVQCGYCDAQAGDPNHRRAETRAGHLASARAAVKRWNTRAY